MKTNLFATFVAASRQSAALLNVRVGGALPRRRYAAAVALAFLSTLNFQLSTAFAQSTFFTYQGRLTSGGSVANGSYDLTFSLWNSASGPSQIGGTITNATTAISNGLFTVTLDFGANF